MSQETITRILSIEHRASRLREDAEKEAARTVAQAERAAATSRERIVADAQKEAEQIVSAAREAAEVERTRVMAQAEAEVAQMEAQAEDHFERAVGFILEQVSGGE